MSTLKTVNLQNPASGIINGTLNSDGTTTFGGVVNFDPAQTFPNVLTSLTAGTGLSGGVITTTGTIALIPATNTVIGGVKPDGTTITVAADGTITATSGAGTVTSVVAGTGLSGGPITTTGTLTLDTTYTNTLYLSVSGGTMIGNITFAGTQTFPNTVSSVTAGTGLSGGTITSTGTINLDTAYTDTLYLGLAGGTMTGDITFSGTQTFPGVLPLAGGTMTGDITFSGTQTFPAQDLNTVTTAGNTTGNGVTVGPLTASGLNYPTSDGTPGQSIATDGSTNLGWFSPVRVVSVPMSSASSGTVGDVAFGNQYLYWYDSGFGWRRILGSAF